VLHHRSQGPLGAVRPDPHVPRPATAAAATVAATSLVAAGFTVSAHGATSARAPAISPASAICAEDLHWRDLATNQGARELLLDKPNILDQRKEASGLFTSRVQAVCSPFAVLAVRLHNLLRARLPRAVRGTRRLQVLLVLEYRLVRAVKSLRRERHPGGALDHDRRLLDGRVTAGASAIA